MDLALNFTLSNPLSTVSHIFDFNLRTLLSEFWGTRRRGLLKTKIKKITQASSFKFTVDLFSRPSPRALIRAPHLEHVYVQ